MTVTPPFFHTQDLEQQAHLFASCTDATWQSAGLWNLWAQLLERDPVFQRERLRAIGDSLEQSKLDAAHRSETGEIRAGLVLDLPAERGEARLWHHLLLYGGDQRLRVARAWLKGGFQPWAEVGTTPLDLLLNTGDTALCALLFAHIPQDRLAERFAQTFTPQLSAARRRAGEREDPLYGLARWCLQQKKRMAPGKSLTEHLGTAFTDLPLAQHVKLTEYVQTDDGVVQWWRILHEKDRSPPPLPLSVLNALLARREPPPLSHDEVTRLGELFNVPVLEKDASGGAEDDEREADVQRLFIQDYMKNGLRDTATPGITLLYHLQEFLDKKGVPSEKNINTRFSGLASTPDDVDIPLLQPLVAEWAQTLPLDATLESKGGRWSIPALILRELFEPITYTTEHATDPQDSTVTHLLWMTLLLNALWQAASAPLQAQWAAGDALPLKRGKKPDMTRPWIFWSTRLHACVSKEMSLPALTLPPLLSLPDTEGLLFDLHSFKNKRTERIEETDTFRHALWEKDIQLHPSVWKTPSLFTLERLETLWVPYAATLSLRQGWMPSDLEPMLTEALCDLLEKDEKTLTLSVVSLARVALCKEFFPPGTSVSKPKALEDRLVPQQRLLAALEGWFQVRPEAHAGWCELKSGDTDVDSQWRRFWEQRFLEGQLVVQDEHTRASKRTRMRV